MISSAPSLQEKAAAELELRRRQAEAAARSLTFRQFIERVSPRYRFYRHCEQLIRVLQRVADGEIKRLMVFMPPRHGKSETISRLFPAYFLYRYPHRWVGINSYSAELAYTLSRAARENYREAGGTLSGDASAVKHWETGRGGGLWAAGVGGPITGKGFHLGIIDDPLKNAKEAESATIRHAQKEWYGSTFYTREEPWSDDDPHGAVIVLQTRWNQDDLSGWLLSEEQGEEPEGWHIISMPAIAEETPPSFPATCTVESDWRSVGEALCPERRPLKKLARIAGRISEYFWNALFQQRPIPRSGGFFKTEQIEIIRAVPPGLRRCRGWDLAASAGRGDYTAGVLLGVDAAGVWYVLDVRRGQYASDERDRLMKQTAALDGSQVTIRLAQDPGQAGKDQAGRLVKMLAGFVVKSETVTGQKVTRADALASQVNIGNVKMLAGDWNRSFIEELKNFPFGSSDDQVDAASDAFNELADGPTEAEHGPSIY